jgi:hypothetical protein
MQTITFTFKQSNQPKLHLPYRIFPFNPIAEEYKHISLLSINPFSQIQDSTFALNGGGHSNIQAPIDVDIVNIQNSINTNDPWIQLSQSPLKIVDCSNSKITSWWTPPNQIQYKKSTHLLFTNISQTNINILLRSCQLHPNQTVLRIAKRKDICIRTNHLRNFITYGQLTSDAVISLYLEGFCHQHRLTYLTSFFIPHLKTHGWTKVRTYFANHQKAHSRRIDRPKVSGEPTILIPSFIHNNHWVALVRCEIRQRVYFLYSDDLNNTNTEKEMKSLIRQKTNEEFCPPDSIWMHCKSTTYLPHSSECGPRAILAMVVLATHPNPHPEMLLPLMHDNLAQITRSWLAHSIITGNFETNIFEPIFSISHMTDNRTANRANSNQYDIILWDSTTTHKL